MRCKYVKCMRRILALFFVVLVGCSTAPLVDFLDAVAPGASSERTAERNRDTLPPAPKHLNTDLPPRLPSRGDPPPLPPPPVDRPPDPDDEGDRPASRLRTPP